MLYILQVFQVFSQDLFFVLIRFIYYVFAYHMCLGVQRSEGIRVPGTGVTDACEPP